MLKQTVTYQDFNGKTKTENLYFNIAKSEVADNLSLVDDVETIQQMLDGEQRELSRLEIQKILDLVKTMIRLSHGARSEDGSRFRKNQETWDEFVETGAYDAFVMSLFENPAEAMRFIVNVLPQDLIDQTLKAELDSALDEADGGSKNVVTTPAPALAAVPEEKPAEERTWESYTRTELVNMGKEQFDKLAGSDPQKMPHELLVIAMQRKSQA